MQLHPYLNLNHWVNGSIDCKFERNHKKWDFDQRQASFSYKNESNRGSNKRCGGVHY